MNSKKVMVIAGSKWQIPIVKKISQMGHSPLVVNLYEDSPAFAYADKHGVMDILDKNACLKFAKENDIDAVLSEECDIAMPTVAYLSGELGLSSLSVDMAALYTNKFKMREFCKENGIPYPEYRKCYDISEAEDFFHSINKKIIIKPLDANSSRGVYTITNLEELKKYFPLAMEYSKVENCVLAERYIEGTEFTVDGIKTPEKHYTMAISQKKHYPHNPNVACELYFSHSNDGFDYELLKKVNDKFVNESGLEFGLTHAEYKYENGEFYLIEIAARGGGNLISADIVPVMTGIDNYKYLVECSLGNIYNSKFEIPKEYENRCSVLHFFDVPGDGGMVESIKGIDFLNDTPNIIKWEMNFEIGDVIEKAKDDSKRAGYYIAYAENRAELDALIKEIDNQFDIIYRK